MDHVWQIGHLGPPENEMLEAYTTSKARIPYSTGEVLNHVAVSEDSGRPNSSARESALVVMLVIAVLLPFVRIGRHAAVGQDGQASDGRLCAGSYKVTPPGRSRAYSTTQQADRSIEGQQNRVRLTESQTHPVVPGTSSLAYGHAWRLRRPGTNMVFVVP
jgi:cytochrome c-type biogenesis protein CcmH/NrfG